jgi:hypothetical protein
MRNTHFGFAMAARVLLCLSVTAPTNAAQGPHAGRRHRWRHLSDQCAARGACYAMSSVMAFGVAGRGAELRIQQKQLDVCGIYELQALEGVLRTDGQNSSKWQSEVARRIQNANQMAFD